MKVRAQNAIDNYHHSIMLGAGLYHGDSYILNTKEMKWEKLSAEGAPISRGWHDGDSLNGAAVIFGGFDGETRRNDLFIWNPTDH